MIHFLEFLAIASVILAPVWVYTRRPKQSETDHHWHKKENCAEGVFICCYCEETFDSYEMVQQPECGPYAPKDFYPTPSKTCPKRMCSHEKAVASDGLYCFTCRRGYPYETE